MATVFQVTITILDSKGQSSRVLYHVPEDRCMITLDADPYEVVKAYAQYLATALDRIITGAIIDISIAIKPGLPAGIKTSPLVGSDVEEKLDCKFPEGANSAFYRNQIPTFDHSLFGAC